MIAGAAEHDECDEAVRVVEAVGHADGDLDPVVGRLEPGVGVAQLDGPEDVGPRRRIFRDGLPLSYNCTICRLNASSWWRGCSGPAIVGLQSHVIRPSSDCLIRCSQSTASHRQAVRVEEEIVDAHREDAVLVADGFDHVAYEDDLLEAVVDLEQRGFSCATFSGVGSWYADWSGRRWRRPARRPGRRAPATCAARCACAAAR